MCIAKKKYFPLREGGQRGVNLRRERAAPLSLNAPSQLNDESSQTYLTSALDHTHTKKKVSFRIPIISRGFFSSNSLFSFFFFFFSSPLKPTVYSQLVKSLFPGYLLTLIICSSELTQELCVSECVRGELVLSAREEEEEIYV